MSGRPVRHRAKIKKENDRMENDSDSHVEQEEEDEDLSQSQSQLQSQSQSQSQSREDGKIEGVIDPDEERVPQFGLGAIRSIRLQNFVTFDDVYMDSSAGLNLIIGPNGTGKSSIVCAIMLGLGGGTQSLGRGDKISDFIKRGKTEASIEIRLNNGYIDENTKERSDATIKRTIKHGSGDDAASGSSIWRLNGKVVAKHVISDLTNSLNIKVNNLCQFLAQDKVSDFARLSPTQLLEETQRAIEDDQLYRWHKEVIRLSADSIDFLRPNITALRENFQSFTNEKKTLEKHAQQFERSKKLKRECNILLAKDAHVGLANEKTKIEKARKETQEGEMILENAIAKLKPYRVAANNARKSEDSFSSKMNRINLQIKREDDALTHERKELEKIENKMIDEEAKINAEMDRASKKDKEFHKKQKELNNLELKLKDGPNLGELEEQKKQCDIELAKTRQSQRENKKKQDGKSRQRDQLHLQKQTLQYQLNGLKNVENNRMRYIYTLSRSHEEFDKWLMQHSHENKGQIYGPIARYVKVKDYSQQFGRQGDLQLRTYLEHAIGRNTLQAYVVTDKDDLKRLVNQVGIFKKNSNQHFANISIIEQSNIERLPNNHRCSQDVLARNGIVGYLDDFYDAPDIIRAAISGNKRLDLMAFALNEPNANQVRSVLRQNSQQVGVLDMLYTPGYLTTVRISHYGERDPVAQSSPVWHFQNAWIQTYHDNSEAISNLENNSTELENQINGVNQELEELVKENSQIAKENRDIKIKRDPLMASIKDVHKIITQINSLKKRIEQFEQAGDIKEMKFESDMKMYDFSLEKAKLMSSMSERILKISQLFQTRNEFKILTKFYHNEKKHFEKSESDIQKQSESLKERIKQNKRNLKKLEKQFEITKHDVNSRYAISEYKELWEEDWMKEYGNDSKKLKDAYESKHADLTYLSFDSDRVRRFEEICKKIESVEKELKDRERDFVDNRRKIDRIVSQWQPKLEHNIRKISRMFAKYFGLFNAKGEVKLIQGDSFFEANNGNNNGKGKNKNNNENNNNNNNNNDNDNDNENEASAIDLKCERYDDWTIDIMTKFRDDQPWTKLSANSQSGGEKSITTMIYLLSLQEVTTVPFRVVDEINQGMDAINERRIMQILNYTCLPKHAKNNDTPQYFVITPKLLPRLEYAKSTALYIIYNGPFQLPQKCFDECTQPLTQAMQRQTQSPVKGKKSQKQLKLPAMSQRNRRRHGKRKDDDNDNNDNDDDHKTDIDMSDDNEE